jgi:2-polyprenyl-3-methyl-5-hydroxy-6-metoxy-1,4-benzoquinol methylase
MVAWHHAGIDDKRLRAQTYSESYRADYGFEATMVRVRQDSTLRALPSVDDLVVVEVGCGTDLLVERAMSSHGFETWVIVEPSAVFAGAARERVAHDTRVQVIEAFFEEAGSEIVASCGRLPDVVILASVLHEVDDPGALLNVAANLLDPGGQIIVNVPNARSLHRRLAVAMGLITAPHELSARNA